MVVGVQELQQRCQTKTPTKIGLDCDNHTLIDLPGLAEQRDRSCLVSKWKECKGYEIIVHRTEIVVRKLVIQAYDQLKTNIYL